MPMVYKYSKHTYSLDRKFSEAEPSDSLNLGSLNLRVTLSGGYYRDKLSSVSSAVPQLPIFDIYKSFKF